MGGGRTSWQERYKNDCRYENLRTFGVVCHDGTAWNNARSCVFVGFTPWNNMFENPDQRTRKFTCLQSPTWDENGDMTENYLSELKHGLQVTHRQLPSCNEEEEDTGPPRDLRRDNEPELKVNEIAHGEPKSKIGVEDVQSASEPEVVDVQSDSDEIDDDTPAARRSAGLLDRGNRVQSYVDLAKYGAHKAT